MKRRRRLPPDSSDRFLITPGTELTPRIDPLLRELRLRTKQKPVSTKSTANLVHRGLLYNKPGATAD
jgi:hypothetical protein